MIFPALQHQILCLSMSSVTVIKQNKVKTVDHSYQPFCDFLFFPPRMSREQQAVARARKAFETGRSKSLEHRIRQLKSLQRLFVERQKEISDAVKKDLNKVSNK